ncbi:MAG: DUF2235 domain-containing protein [Marinobacter sp.]|uniref:T6SS phospholipase effector Tle1-like catalytic domain-containing protein n=2 Tax=Marinobacter sp. TaxID=50741 RepID=UPI0032997539
MKLVRSRDLTAYDLPRIESPFLAANKVQHLLADPFSALQLPQDLPRKPYGRNAYPDTLQDQVRNGELLLVLGPVDGFPVSPVVTWHPGEHFPGGGQWKVNTLIVGAFLENDVAKLNEWAVTPEQLRSSNPAGIGGFRSRTFGIDMQIRHHAENHQRQSSSGSALTLPLGSAASVIPLPATASPATDATKKSEEPAGIHLEVGIFTDGTLNNATNTRVFKEQLEKECLAPFENDEISQEECERRLGLMLGGSYSNAPSNVAKLWDLYPNRQLRSDNKITFRRSIYAPGAGSKSGSEDSLYGAATGLGAAGVIRQVHYAFSQLAMQMREDLQGKQSDQLKVDLFGFSRGAAAARHAAHEINIGPGGLLAKVLSEYGVAWPKEVRIRFVGLYDTVAGIVNVFAGDLAADNARNSPVKLYLDPGQVDHAVHLTATHEHRKNFALNSLRSPNGTLPANFREIALPGAHSDIGGGYGDSQREEVLISPLLPVPPSRLRWPEKSMEWDNLEALRTQVAAEGWIGLHSLPVRQSRKPHNWEANPGSEGDASLDIVTNRKDHPAPEGEVELALRMTRQVRGDYSRVALRMMHRLATDKGVPLKDVGATKRDETMPEELKAILDKLMQQVKQGDDEPSLSRESHELLLQRYIHYSANYNSFETLIGEVPVRVSLFRHVRPHAPASSRERRVYPQQEGC